MCLLSMSLLCPWNSGFWPLAIGHCVLLQHLTAMGSTLQTKERENSIAFIKAPRREYLVICSPSNPPPPLCYMAPHGFPNNGPRVPRGHQGSPENCDFSANPCQPENGSPVGPHRVGSWKIGDSTWEPSHRLGGPDRRKRWNGTWVRINVQRRLQANQVLPTTANKPKTAFGGPISTTRRA